MTSPNGQSPFDELPVVRRIRRQIRSWWSIEVAFTDATGYVLDHARGLVVPPHNALCRAELTSEDGFRRCNRSVANGVTEVLASGTTTPVIQWCHLGFPMVVVPVTYEGRRLGALFAGGFVVNDDDLQAHRRAIAEAAVAHRVQVQDAEEAIAGGPVISRKDLSYLRDLMEIMAQEVAARFGSTDSSREWRADDGDEAAEALRAAHIVGHSRALLELGELVALVSRAESTALITGENGTGKELVARAIHTMSRRKDRPFVVQNCSALNDNLLESELFGYARGAFTGAGRDKKGLFEVANGGTFFLDEVGDMSPAMQVKVLRVLQNGTFTPVGDTEMRKVDVRIVAATHRPLRDMVDDGRFREDLYYRLNVINLHLPPLRERLDDLPVLCDHFLDTMARRTGRRRKQLGAGCLDRFFAYPWPGNIRELENEIERLVVLSGDKDVISAEVVSERIGRTTSRIVERAAARGTLQEAMGELERHMIAEGLVRTHWNKRQLAARLGISRTTLLKKIKEYELEGPRAAFRF